MKILSLVRPYMWHAGQVTGLTQPLNGSSEKVQGWGES